MTYFLSEKYIGSTGTPGISREDTVRMVIGRLKFATLAYKASALTTELNTLQHLNLFPATH